MFWFIQGTCQWITKETVVILSGSQKVTANEQLSSEIPDGRTNCGKGQRWSKGVALRETQKSLYTQWHQIEEFCKPAFIGNYWFQVLLAMDLLATNMSHEFQRRWKTGLWWWTFLEMTLYVNLRENVCHLPITVGLLFNFIEY